MTDSARRPPVVLIHGLERVRIFLYPLAWFLRRKGREVVFFRYEPRRNDVRACAESLKSFLRECSEPVDLVGFSLGGVLCAVALRDGESRTRVRRAVLLGSPVAGARLARWVNHFRFSRFIFGRCFVDLATERDFCPKDFGIEVAMIAGGRGRKRGFNPLLPEDNDFLVQVSETLSPAFSEHFVVHRNHWSLTLRVDVQEKILRFLDTGRISSRFSSEESSS